MKETKTGSEGHKQEFLASLERNIQENLWQYEIKRHRLEQLKASLESEQKTIQEQVHQKLFPTAGDGRRALKDKEKAITDVQVEINHINSQMGLQMIDQESIRRFRDGDTQAKEGV